MKIVICGSMSASNKMVEMGNALEKLGHSIDLPRQAHEYANGSIAMEGSRESAENKITHDLIRDHYDKIKNADAVLALNVDKKGISNYIGGNTFLELGFAHVLDKKIFLLNPVPDIGYTSEIIAMQPVIIDGDLGKIN